MKKITMSIIILVISIALCACGEAKQNLDSEDRILAIQMKINLNKAVVYFSDSNTFIIDAVNAIIEMEDEERIRVCFKEALELVKEAKNIIDDSISCPNFISKKLGEIEENYEETIILLERFSELSEEEMDEVVDFILDGSSKYVFLIKYLNAFSYLYAIREFDQLPDDEAQSNLKDSWWEFGFNEDIECPETIDEQELYLMWAQRFFEKVDEDKFMEELQVLRENDDLSNPDCNQKWTEFIENFILQTEYHSS